MKITKENLTWSNVKAFITGWFRYYLYYSSYNNLIPRHIREQIDMRIRSMNKECLDSGQCVMCGCTTTALQMSNKMCEGHCYPPMMNKEEWANFKVLKGHYFLVRNTTKPPYYCVYFSVENNKFIKHEC